MAGRMWIQDGSWKPSEIRKGKQWRRQRPSLAWLWLDLSLAVVSRERMCWLVKMKNKAPPLYPPRYTHHLSPSTFNSLEPLHCLLLSFKKIFLLLLVTMCSLQPIFCYNGILTAAALVFYLLSFFANPHLGMSGRRESGTSSFMNPT